MPRDTAILFHGPGCPDGFAAAWVCHSKFGDNAHYYPINYGDSVIERYPTITLYKELYIVDFSFSREILLELANNARVIVLDHHKTAREALSGLELPNRGEVHFDMDRSGAVMTWDYFYGSESRPELVKYVQDRDLWKWELPNSKAVSAALALEELTFEAWSGFANRLADDDGYVSVTTAGNSVLRYIEPKIDRIVSISRVETIGGHVVPSVNSSILESEIGERLCKIYTNSDFAAVWYVMKDGKRKYSLRSRGGFDVSAVAKKYGGGGHAAAAGFILDVS